MKLAINGGKPVRTKLFPAYNTIGEEEKKAVARVMETGNLSQYLGAWHDDFYGGPEVRAFESAWAEAFEVKHALSVNSNTSGLFAAMGSCDVGPGDEVIVSPYTMSASAIAPIVYGAVPVFADIDENTFCLSVDSIRERITERTKAILVVHIFGHPADMDPIMSLARERGIRVIEDCAQAPLSKYKGRYVGSIGDLGVFSLNYHKHVHTGEGGVVTTNDDEVAERIALIRNHGEAVVGPKGRPDLSSLVGFNYRMTEINAAIGTEQLRKLPDLISQRQQNVDYLDKLLNGITCLDIPRVQDDCSHAFYVRAMKFKPAEAGVERNTFVGALKAELPSAVLRETVPLVGAGYTSPLYLQPFYQQRTTACAFNCPRYEGSVSYDKGICPVTERMHYEELFFHEWMRPGMSQQDLDDVATGFEKVERNLDELREWEAKEKAGA